MQDCLQTQSLDNGNCGPDGNVRRPSTLPVGLGQEVNLFFIFLRYIVVEVNLFFRSQISLELSNTSIASLMH